MPSTTPASRFIPLCAIAIVDCGPLKEHDHYARAQRRYCRSCQSPFPFGHASPRLLRYRRDVRPHYEVRRFNLPSHHSPQDALEIRSQLLAFAAIFQMRRCGGCSIDREFAIQVGHQFFLLDGMCVLEHPMPRCPLSDCKPDPGNLSTPCAIEIIWNAPYSKVSAVSRRFLSS